MPQAWAALSCWLCTSSCPPFPLAPPFCGTREPWSPLLSPWLPRLMLGAWPPPARSRECKLRSWSAASVPVAGGLLESLTSGLALGPGGQGAQSLPFVFGFPQPRGPPLPAFRQALRGCRLQGAGHVAHCSRVHPGPPLGLRPLQTVLRASEPDTRGAEGPGRLPSL